MATVPRGARRKSYKTPMQMAGRLLLVPQIHFTSSLGSLVTGYEESTQTKPLLPQAAMSAVAR